MRKVARAWVYVYLNKKHARFFTDKDKYTGQDERVINDKPYDINASKYLFAALQPIVASAPFEPLVWTTSPDLKQAGTANSDKPLEGLTQPADYLLDAATHAIRVSKEAKVASSATFDACVRLKDELERAKSVGSQRPLWELERQLAWANDKIKAQESVQELMIEKIGLHLHEQQAKNKELQESIQALAKRLTEVEARLAKPELKEELGFRRLSIWDQLKLANQQDLLAARAKEAKDSQPFAQVPNKGEGNLKKN